MPIIKGDLRRILIRATNWIGDAVMSLPAFQAVRGRYPDAYIAVLARPWVADVYARESFANEVIPYASPHGWRDFGGKWKFAQRLREKNFDSAILLPNSFDAAAIVRLAGIPRRIGYARDGRSWLLTDAIPTPGPQDIPGHERYYYLELLRRAGILDSLPELDRIRLGGTSEAREAGLLRFAEMGLANVTGISPGAAYGGAKRWLPERFAEAASALGNACALFGSKDEGALCDSIAAQISKHGLAVHNFAGKTTLREFIDLAAACQVYLTNDSGSMHIASALDVPTVAIFGATNHVGTGPTGPLARVVREMVECSPCLLRDCPLKGDDHHRCMKAVTADRVATEAKELISLSQR